MHGVHTRKMRPIIDKGIEMEDSGEMNGPDKRMSVRAHKKTRMTMYFEPAILAWFRDQAAHRGAGYQTLINEALRHVIHADSAPLTVETLRRVLREELKRHLGK
jgi:uncharacterized protein (DUF4415 family)